MKKRWLILIIIAVIILLPLIIYTFFPNLFLKDCRNELSCIRTAFDKCSFAKYETIKNLEQFCKPGSVSCTQGSASITEYVEIRGSWLGGCRVYIRWDDATGVLRKWKDYDMKCVIDNTNYNFNDLGPDCKGKLLEAYNDAYYSNEYGFTGSIAPLN